MLVVTGHLGVVESVTRSYDPGGASSIVLAAPANGPPEPIFWQRRCQVPTRIGLGEALAAERFPSADVTLAHTGTTTDWRLPARLSPLWLVGGEDPPGSRRNGTMARGGPQPAAAMPLTATVG